MRRVTLLTLLFCAGSAHAYRRELIVTMDGVRVHGAQVCFSSAAATNTAYALFFSYGEDVGCLPADAVIDMPTGVWHVFARQGKSGASATQDYLANRGDPMPEQGYESLEIPLHPAGVLDVTKLLPALEARNASVGVWLDSTNETLSTYLPLVPGEHEIVVPANIPFVPIVTSGGKPLRLGSVMTVAAGDGKPFRIFSHCPRERISLRG
jgi:hypothetical protein